MSMLYTTEVDYQGPRFSQDYDIYDLIKGAIKKILLCLDKNFVINIGQIEAYIKRETKFHRCSHRSSNCLGYS